MKCPGCGLEFDTEQENPQWITCPVCSWEGHPVEALDFGTDEDTGDEEPVG